jgi:arginyl-tRNA synthetase
MATVKKLIARNLGQITGHAEKLFLDNLERPVNKSFGDFAFPAHRLIQAEKTSPRSLVPEPLRSNANGCAKFLAENVSALSSHDDACL